MTDVFIAYAREDLERVRPIAESLQAEGWDVWWESADPSANSTAATDQKLGSAGAILVVWSTFARSSEYVRSEAATGLYKNKLIQVRIDSAGAPRPFDQVEVVNLGGWRGDRQDESWRRVLAAARLYAGAPGISRPQAMRRATRRPSLPAKPSYAQGERSFAWGPIAAAAGLIVAGATLWFIDPFDWRPGEGARSASAEPAPMAARAELAAIPAAFEDTEAAEASWAAVEREEPRALRDFVIDYPRTSHAETAKALLRVLDAQAWVEAVTADNEAGYTAYLRKFPVDGSPAGAMAEDARDRLVSLSLERTQAIEDIQRGLAALDLYGGEIDGKGGGATVQAMRSFAASKRKSAPSLTGSAPRDLRTFSDLIRREAGGDSDRTAERAPIVASATRAPRGAEPAGAAQADKQRIAAAQAAARQAVNDAAVDEQRYAAETLAATLSKQDAEAWTAAERTGTAAAYRSYLAAYPAGANASAARAAVQKLSRPAAFALEQVTPALRASVEAARSAQATANSRAAAARETAAAAQSAPNLRNITAADGDRYETQISNGAPNGLGIRVSGEAASLGDRYRGELRNGLSSGLGVYDYADNPNNTRAGAQRYEGEHAADGTSGHGVTYWKSGDTFAGEETSTGARGVLTFANGQRYEGEVRNGLRNGLGVVWSSDGRVVQAGRWQNGELVEPLSAVGAIALAPQQPSP